MASRRTLRLSMSSTAFIMRVRMATHEMPDLADNSFSKGVYVDMF